MIPYWPHARPSNGVAKSTPFKVAETRFWTAQFSPESVVRATNPNSPTTHPTGVSGKKRSNPALVVPFMCSVQVDPASVVR